MNDAFGNLLEAGDRVIAADTQRDGRAALVRKGTVHHFTTCFVFVTYDGSKYPSRHKPESVASLEY